VSDINSLDHNSFRLRARNRIESIEATGFFLPTNKRGVTVKQEFNTKYSQSTPLFQEEFF